MANKTPPADDQPSGLEQKLEAARAKYAKAGSPPPAPPPSALGRWLGVPGLQADPVAQAVTALGQRLETMPAWARAGVGLPPGPTPAWVKGLARLAIPQNAAEAAAFVATLPLGGAGGLAAKLAPKAVAHLTRKGALAGAERLAATGGVTAGAGALTGHDPLEAFGLGAGSRLIGEAVGAGVKRLIHSSVAKKIAHDVTPKLADTIRTHFGRWLTEGPISDQQVLREVVADRLSRKVGNEINTVKQKLAKTPVEAMDLAPQATAHGVVYAWPTQAGRFAEGLGPGRVPALGPGVKAIGPGAELATTTPGGALQPSRVAFGPLWDAVTEALELTEKSLAQAADDPALLARYYGLSQVREKLAGRVETPELQQLLKEYGRTKAIRDLFWGARGKAAAYGEKLDLFDGEGNLSAEGAAIIQKRITRNAPAVADTLGEETMQSVGNAVNWKEHLGLATPTIGKGIGVLKPGIWATPGGLHPHISTTGGAMFSKAPGWEAGQTVAQELAPGAVQAIVGPAAGKHLPTGVAADILRPALAEAADGPPPGPGATIPPAKLRDPYALDLGAPPASPPAGPPPTPRPAPPTDWFPGEAPPSAPAPKETAPEEARDVYLSVSKPATEPAPKEPE